MGARTESTTRIDHNRSGIGRRIVPGRADPERSDPDGLVKRFPAIAPVSGDVLPPHTSEDVPKALLAARVDRQAVDERAAADNTTPSDVIREALRRYLQAS